MQDDGYYTRRTGRINRPREYNRIVDLDRIRILDSLCAVEKPLTMAFLHEQVSESNGLRPKEWDFYYVLRQMEEDALLLAKYDPNYKSTMVKATEYGRQRFGVLKEQLRTILAK